MSLTPPVVPTIAPARAIMLPASFAACGVLVLALFVALVGCGKFLGSDPKEAVNPNERNAVLCSCECEGAVEIAGPSDKSIAEVQDDAVQAPGQSDATLNNPVLTLGQGNHVGLRFRKLSIPRLATIDSAYIQFSAAQTSPDTSDLGLDIKVVDSSNAPEFTNATDLGALGIAGQVQWDPADWTTLNERDAAERTPDLKGLVQAIVSRADYTPDSAIAFVITGSNGRRIARALDGVSRGGRAPALTVAYTPKKRTQEFLACGNATDQASQEALCRGVVQDNVAAIAQQCKVANSCTCKVSTRPNVDKTSFSAVCNNAKPGEPGCPKVLPPADCNPDGIAQTTAATNSHTPVCVVNSPLGSALFGRLSACEIEGTPGCGSTDGDNSCVSVRVFDDDDSQTSYSPPRGRVEFAEKPCSAGSRCYGLKHRVHIGDLTFDAGFLGGLFSGDPRLTELSGVGASTVNAAVGGGGAGEFAAGWTKHSVRGREEDGDPVAVFRTGDRPIGFSFPSTAIPLEWQSNGVCALRGMLLQTDHVEFFANLRGKLVNQPPTAVLDPEPDPVECDGIGGAVVALDASPHDPDNNAASFAWFKGSRTGPLIGTLGTVEVEQAVNIPGGANNTTSYWFKVVDEFGQYAEATTKISVVDTTDPTVTAPPAVTAECTGHAGTPVDIGTATASDVCDGSLPPPGNNAPPLFPLGTTTVLWTAKDASNNEGSATQLVTIVDKTPPTLSFQLSPSVLWSPDHKLVPITAAITVEDKCDPNPTVKLLSITMAPDPPEMDNGLGDGNTTKDIQGATFGSDDRTFFLRAERSGPGSGRVYTIKYEASDASGNTTTSTATVTVPKSQGQASR